MLSSYYVPAEINEIKTRENDFVWVWYYPLPEDAPGFAEALTDVDGKRHLTTIARGKASPAVWNKIRSEGVPNLQSLSKRPASLSSLQLEISQHPRLYSTMGS
jgi:hypothetical protein